MKKLVICLFIGLMAWSSQAQRFDTGWYFSAGFNAVGNLGTRNPVENLGDFAFRTPFAVAFENKWSREFAIEQDLSFNGFKKGVAIDNGTPDKTLTYFSTNTNFKWYFTDYIFPEEDWLDVYVGAGVGLFTIEELNTSGNISVGAAYWFSEYFGVRLQTTAKFAVNAKNREFDNNHWQHFVQAVFRL
jgi:hypothetical protein